jgi:hypothetical protein
MSIAETQVIKSVFLSSEEYHKPIDAYLVDARPRPLLNDHRAAASTEHHKYSNYIDKV